MALTSVTLPYALEIAAYGAQGACAQDRALARGLNVSGGRITHEAVRNVFPDLSG